MAWSRHGDLISVRSEWIGMIDTPEARMARVAASVLFFVIGMAANVGAQTVIGARLGFGGGSADYTIGEVHGRVGLTRVLGLAASYEVMGGKWACVDSPRDALRCGYDGRTISVGGVLAPRSLTRIHGTVRLLIGRFERTGAYAGPQYRGSTHFTAALGADLERRIVGPVMLQLGLIHRQIFDGPYRDTIGGYPHVTAVVVGLSLVLRG